MILPHSENPNLQRSENYLTMNTEGLSIICSGLGSIEETEGANYYSKDEYCLGKEMFSEQTLIFNFYFVGADFVIL